MAQTTSGIRAVLSHPIIYELLQTLCGVRGERARLARDRVGLDAKSVLDIGCGTAAMLHFLPNARYVGLDLSEAYIARARERENGRGTFLVGRFDENAVRHLGPFDVVLMVGFLHHLDDGEAHDVLQSCRRVIVPGGRVITKDPAFVDGQSPIARWLIRKDRGQNVRTPAAYHTLALATFPSVTLEVVHKTLPVLYTHALMTMRMDA